jgi:hypothetical protein
LLVPLFIPFVDFLNTPKRAARVIARVSTDPSVQTGVYYDQNGKSKLASTLARSRIPRSRCRRIDLH